MFSILDIEATGGNASQGKITEIAIYKHDGKAVIDEYQSLINPKQEIPPYVQRLTGISNKMAEKAPVFGEVAERINEITQGTILVAHNVKADYSFIKTEFHNIGVLYNRERICTLELARELIPGMPSYKLEKLCNSLEIPLSNHHRASSDALATVTLFEKLLTLDPKKVLQVKRK